MQVTFNLKKLGKDQQMASLPVKTLKKIKKLKGRTLENRCNERPKAIRVLLKLLFIHGFLTHLCISSDEDQGPKTSFFDTKLKSNDSLR